MAHRGFWQELKRRHVYRVAVAYAIVGWLLIQVVTQVFPVFHLPDWVDQTVVLLILLGFPIALVLAWAFDATPHGIVRTDAQDGADAQAPLRSHRAGIVVGLVGVLVAFLAGAGWWHGERGSLAVSAAHDVAPAVSIAGADVAAANPPVNPALPMAAQTIPAKSVAVLPFENLSADKGNAYFADGMQDLILTKLADIGDLKVISRTSTMQYGSRPENLKLVGQQLGVAALLEGSVQKAGNEVLINVQLINATTDTHIWAQSYTRTLNNIFGVEGEVAQKIAEALKAKLSPTEATAVANVPTTNRAAYDAYLRGETYLGQMWAGDFAVVPKAVAAFRQAVDHDPQFALAWAQLAFSQSMLSYTSIDTSDATRGQALANAQHALALAPDLPQAHYALGYVYRFGFAAYDRALEQFKIAQRGLPNDAEVEAAIAYIEALRGDDPATLADLQRATVLNPRDPNLALNESHEQSALRHYDQARFAAQRVLAIAPNDPEAYTALANLQVLQHGDVRAAMAQLDKAPADLQSGAEILAARVGLLLLQRDYKAAQRAVDALRPGGRFVTPLHVLMLRATVSRFSGDLPRAKTLYQQALVMAESAAKAETNETTVLDGLAIPIAQAALGHRTAALHAMDSLRTLATERGLGIVESRLSWERARVYVMLGDNDAAIAALDKALAASLGATVSVPLLELDPTWDPIRHDPRFQALLKKYTMDSLAVIPAAPASGITSTASAAASTP